MKRIMRLFGYVPVGVIDKMLRDANNQHLLERGAANSLGLHLVNLRMEMNRLQRKLGRARERNRTQHRELKALKRAPVIVAVGAHHPDCRCAECGYGL